MEKKSKKIIIIVILIAVVSAIASVVIDKANSLSPYGEQAIIYAQKLKNALKYPDTMQFTDDIKYLNYFDGECDFFYFSGKNDFGNDVPMKYVFIDGYAYDLNDYMPDKYDYTDYNGNVDREAYQIALDEAQKVANANMTLSLYTTGMSSDDVIIKNIPSNKILKELH